MFKLIQFWDFPAMKFQQTVLLGGSNFFRKLCNLQCCDISTPFCIKNHPDDTHLCNGRAEAENGNVESAAASCWHLFLIRLATQIWKKILISLRSSLWLIFTCFQSILLNPFLIFESNTVFSWQTAPAVSNCGTWELKLLEESTFPTCRDGTSSSSADELIYGAFLTGS